LLKLQVKVVEVMGRRSLLLFGQAGMFVFYAVMTISFRFEVRLISRDTFHSLFARKRWHLSVQTEHDCKLSKTVMKDHV